jgi:hypothetical protein
VLRPRQQERLAGGRKVKEHAMSRDLNSGIAVIGHVEVARALISAVIQKADEKFAGQFASSPPRGPGHARIYR